MRRSNPKRAVVCGLPVVLLRRGLVGIVAVMLLVGATVGMFWVVPGLDTRVLVRYGVVLVLLGSVPGMIAVCVVPWWMIASIQRVVRRPTACLNCGYATIDEAARLCPECGRLDNREDLNGNWKRHVGAAALGGGGGGG